MARPRPLAIAAVVVALVGGVAWLNTPPVLVNAATQPQLPENIDAYLAAAERRVVERFALIPGTEKRVTWHG